MPGRGTREQNPKVFQVRYDNHTANKRQFPGFNRQQLEQAEAKRIQLNKYLPEHTCSLTRILLDRPLISVSHSSSSYALMGWSNGYNCKRDKTITAYLLYSTRSNAHRVGS